MQTSKKTATRKLLIRFDNELKNLLSSDLKLFMAKNPFMVSKKQLAVKQELTVA